MDLYLSRNLKLDEAAQGIVKDLGGLADLQLLRSLYCGAVFSPIAWLGPKLLLNKHQSEVPLQSLYSVCNNYWLSMN